MQKENNNPNYDAYKGLDFIVRDLADMYRLKVRIKKHSATLPADTWEIKLTEPKSSKYEIYRVDHVGELDTYDKGASMALNLINHAVRQIFYGGAGCPADGSVEKRFDLKTGY